MNAASVLEQIEVYIAKVKEEAFSRKELLEKVEKWLAACDEECWLEEYNRVECSQSSLGVTDGRLSTLYCLVIMFFVFRMKIDIMLEEGPILPLNVRRKLDHWLINYQVPIRNVALVIYVNLRAWAPVLNSFLISTIMT